jgi:branched-chain amino acid transport system substrate-binding protein
MTVTRTISLLALAVSVAGGGCRSGEPRIGERASRAASQTGDIVVAAVWPWEARREIRFGEGLRLAVDEVNAAGGIRGRHVRLELRDDKESVDEGRLIAQSLGADPNVVAVIGHLQSYVSVPAAAIYDLSGLLMISPAATDPQLTAQGYRRVFRASFTDQTVGRSMAEFAAARGFKRMAIVYVRDTYGRDLANAFEERAVAAGIRVAARQSYDVSGADDKTFQSILRQWKGLDFDAIFLAGEVPTGAIFVAEARRAGLHMPILTGDAMNSPELVRVAGTAAEGTIVAAIFHPDEPRADVRKFSDAFTRKYGVAPDAGSALGYDAVHLLAEAMRRAGTVAPDDVARSLHSIHDWTGVTGPFSFDASGDPLVRPVVKLVVRNGHLAYLGDVRVAQTGSAR